MLKQVKRWKNFLNFLPQMFNSSSIVALAGNIKVLCAVGDFGNGTFSLPPKLNSSTNVQLTTIAPIAQNTCYKLAAVGWHKTKIGTRTLF